MRRGEKGLIVFLMPDYNILSFCFRIVLEGTLGQVWTTHWAFLQPWISGLGGQLAVLLPEGTGEGGVLAAAGMACWALHPAAFESHSLYKTALWGCAKPRGKTWQEEIHVEIEPEPCVGVKRQKQFRQGSWAGGRREWYLGDHGFLMSGCE